MSDDLEPLIRTPVSDMGGALFTEQLGRCADFELRFKHCLEAYGKHQGRVKCKDYLDDFNECIYGTKQKARFNAMYDERLRQYKQGERKLENYYGPIPKPDSI